MTTLIWIFVSGIETSYIALVGSMTLILSDASLKKLVLPLIAFAAGSLIGGPFFHMIRAAVDEMLQLSLRSMSTRESIPKLCLELTAICESGSRSQCYWMTESCSTASGLLPEC
ncbi:hypothetical protein [Mariniblastus fucicola]|uniref:Uncharacterized protein n=1 Tax=Mariniblastus fucicola TaxID=980251 RepID=A0A5B9PAG0_9BACT|nr:hypothetical protein [Mariniblastus fucicola]QEG22479.1 hypothetical protein MFFC18_23590 [Mariniblastus fucicola]